VAWAAGQPPGRQFGGFALLARLAPAWRPYQVKHQCHRTHTIEYKGDERTQHGAGGVGGFGHRHHQGHIKPANGNQYREHGVIEDCQFFEGVGLRY
jgi:hypothetical protein